MIGMPLHACALALAALLQLPGTTDSGPAEAPSPSAPLRTPEVTASAGVAPDSVTVGDHFRVRVRIVAPAGATVEFPEFSLVEPVQSVDTLRLARDSTGGWIATYTLAAWRTSDSLVASFPVRVQAGPGEARDFRVPVRLPFVRSVLPADSSLHLPKPAKAVIPIAVRGPVTPDWLMPAVLLAVALAGIVWLVLRRRGPAIGTPADPREIALAALEAIERERLPERGMVHEYHVRTSRVLRQYVDARGGGGEELTTTELLGGLRRAGTDDARMEELSRLLRESDRVKFAGREAITDAASTPRHGEALRRWIAAWPAAPNGGALTRAEAA